MQEDLSTKTNVTFQLFSSSGKLKKEVKAHNLVVTTGKNYIADQLSSSPSLAKMSHIGLGTSATPAPAAGDLNLVAAIAGGRKAMTSNIDTNNVVTMTATFSTGEATSSNIAEAAIFNASSGGTMLARTVVSPVINKAVDDILVVTWTLTIN